MIYKGRDPGNYDQDNVKGAHFCNANSGTMGISMIGTYTDITPTEAALNSLINLTTWKVGKEHLDPLGTHWHSLNPNLPTIAGHRDGCSTECPGDKLYALLDSIRQAVWDKFKLCGYIVDLTNTLYQNDKPTINVTGNVLSVGIDNGKIVTVTVFDLAGRVIFEKKVWDHEQKVSISLPKVMQGIYILRIRTNNSLYTGKLLLAL